MVSGLYRLAVFNWQLVQHISDLLHFSLKNINLVLNNNFNLTKTHTHQYNSTVSKVDGDCHCLFHIDGDVKCWWNAVSEQRENIECDLSFTCYWLFLPFPELCITVVRKSSIRVFAFDQEGMTSKILAKTLDLQCLLFPFGGAWSFVLGRSTHKRPSRGDWNRTL